MTRRAGRAMRIEDLARRGEREREALAAIVHELRLEVEDRRNRWRLAGYVAAGLAAGATAAWRLFGRHSWAVKVGRWSTLASLALGLGRAAMRLRRFF